MILVFGSVNVDLVARVGSIARPGETVLAPGYERHFGGKGANQAVAAARAQAASAAPVVFCGAVGEDGFGRDSRANLEAAGIDISRVETVAAGTGCAFISVERSGENAITVASGANADMRAASLDDTSLAQGAVLVLQMEVPLAESAALARRARTGGAHVLLNFAPATAEIPPARLREFLEDTDTLVVNEHELETLAKALDIPPEAAAGRIADEFEVRLVVTLGADGALLREPAKPDWRCPAASVEVVDTTGAGDTFVGVLAAGIAEDVPLRDAVRRAGAAASLSCLGAGAQSAMPTRAEIDRFTEERAR